MVDSQMRAEGSNMEHGKGTIPYDKATLYRIYSHYEDHISEGLVYGSISSQ